MRSAYLQPPPVEATGLDFGFNTLIFGHGTKSTFATLAPSPSLITVIRIRQ